MLYSRNTGETTAQWLERLIGLNAPADLRADVRAILASETAGKYIINRFNSLFLIVFIHLLI